MDQLGPFAKLQDANCRIQLYIGKKNLGETEEEVERFNKLVKLLDIGDTIGVSGELFATQTGEVSIRVNDLKFLLVQVRCISFKRNARIPGQIFIHPPPGGLTAVDLRVAQIDLDALVSRNSPQAAQSQGRSTIPGG